MDNKQQQRTSSTLERPPLEANEADGKDSARQYKAHQKAITRGLRNFFNSVAAEPVPDEFMTLLRKMDEGKSEE
ncbi:NepR family anti-sigma factor [Rhizomicrobium electricum]|jgi:hypothetical protein|uniref:Anti-sigma factor NepR domain-containing protein n=1 Tax=Rhizomicrobium electricum TaxID=480070 RepID=A0ABP3PBZ4_9PROT|nr:NepR family anti-sigma factor [Rhizomicrobium electricum]NIJ47832.1 hypothetical protein [Rhizomicrobium electricum]